MPAKNVSSRKWVYGSNAVISTVLFLGILVVVAFIIERHPWRIDLTESGSFSLSEQTLNVLKTIDKPVQVKIFLATGNPDQAKVKDKTRDLLDTYKYYNSNISYEFIDPDAQPEVTRRYEVKTYGTLVLEGFDRKQAIQNSDEENITNALLKLSRKDRKKIYFLTGHGEHSPAKSEKDGYSNAQAALEKNYYATEEFDLLRQAEVPGDAAAVVIAGPKKPLQENELQSLRNYLDRGGKLMVFVDPLVDSGLSGFLKSYGIELSDDVIIDRMSRLFGASERVPVVAKYGTHRITDGFTLPTFYPDARSVVPAKEPPKGVKLETLASAGETAWAERNLDMLKKGQAAFDPNEDLAGPVPIVVLAEITPGEKPETNAGAEAKPAAANPEKTEGKPPKQGVLIAAGNSNFASNAYFGLYGNGDLFQNMVNYMAEEENLITIGPHQAGGQPFLLTQGQARAMFLVVLILVPLAVLVSGLVVYRVRRSQR